MLSEAVVKFQSQAISEIFPAAGPVRTKIVGKITSEKEKQSQRVQNYLTLVRSRYYTYFMIYSFLAIAVFSRI